MIKQLISTLLVTVSASALASNQTLSSPSQASAAVYNAPVRGFYTTLGLGFSSPQPTSAHIPSHYGYSIYGHVDESTGFSGEVGGGYDFGMIRVELTYSYTNNALDTSIGSASGVTEYAKLTGSMTTQTALVSAYHDFKTHRSFTPYAGAGIGYGNIAQSRVTFALPYGTGISDATNLGVFAYRAKIGIAYLVSSTIDVFAEGVYLGSTAYSGYGGFAPNLGDIGPSNDFGAKAGLRYHFA